MSGVGGSLLAFLVAISVLVAVHEFGHFWVARKLGVKVLRFSIGFGRPLLTKKFGKDETEFSIAAIPLGGYVKMLDEREGEVAVEDRHRAFNRQSNGTRSAIAVAGPLFNFLFAIFAYWLMFTSGVPGLKAVVGSVEPGSYAADAGLQPGDELLAIDNDATPTWEEVTIRMLEAALDDAEIAVEVRAEQGASRIVRMDFSQAPDVLDKGGLLDNLGLAPRRIKVPPVIDKVKPGEPAAQAGLASGDRILAGDDTAIEDWGGWVEYVRERPGQAIQTRVTRDGAELVLSLVPRAIVENGDTIGQIGAYVRRPESGSDSLETRVRYGPFAAVGKAVAKTWDMSVLTVRTLWGMVTGKASMENISGPISIAQYAGYSAQVGFSSFLKFLAIVSISLGVLNLLPVPILDGGHLLYNAIEWLSGKPLSEAAQAVGLRIGIAMLLMLMGLAFYNDLSRVFGAS